MQYQTGVQLHAPQWKAVKNRFRSERALFDFETLSFVSGSKAIAAQLLASTNRSESETGRSSSDTGRSPSIKSGGRQSSVCKSFASESQDFSCQLELEPSQQLAREAQRESFRFSGRHSSTRGSTTRHSMTEDTKNNGGGTNLDKLDTTNLKVIGRDREIQLLLRVQDTTTTTTTADSCVSEKMAVIVGPSGSGKSVLAVEVLEQQRQTNHTIWCSGKFDIQNRADPYEAIVQAITSLIRQAQHKNNKALLEEWRGVVQSTLGDETNILLELVPSLALLLEKETAAMDLGASEGNNNEGKDKDVHKDRSITERAMRIQNVLVEFLRLVSTKEHPVTMLLDDIQWAGPASVGLIDALLIDRNMPNFHILTTCRQEYLVTQTATGEPEQQEDSLQSQEKVKINSQLLELLSKQSSRIHQLIIQGLDVSAVQQLINALLRLDETDDRTKALAQIVHHKTNGNPFFVTAFMNVLVDEKLLVYDWASFSWTWIEGDIQSQHVASNVAQAVGKRLQTLPVQELLILKVAACIGNTFERHMLEFVLRGVIRDLQVHNKEYDDILISQNPDDGGWPVKGELETRLESLVEMGILERLFEHGKYEFAHDQIQAAALRMIPSDQTIPMQTAIGKRLIQGLDDNHRDQFLFTAVQLCGMGIRTEESGNRNEASDKEQGHFAFWAFVAGDMALRQGAFDAALGFFDKAARCLGDQPFEKDQQLALPLFSGATEAAYCVGSESVDDYIAMVQSQSSIAEVHKVRVSLIEMRVLTGKRDFQGCADAFRKTCKNLGAANFPKNPSLLNVLYQFSKTAALMKKHNRQKFLEIPECSNPSIRGALSAEPISFYPLYLSNANLCVVATCGAIQWSVKYGHTKATPSALAAMGTFLVGLSGEYEKALEVGETALELCSAFGYKEALPQTTGLVFGFIRHWTKPMHDFLAPMRYATDIGLRLGCMDDVSFLINTFGLLLILTQTNTLQASITEIEGFRHMMIEMKHVDHLSFTECNLQFAHKLAFPQKENLSMDGDVMNEEAMHKVAKTNKDFILTGFIQYFKMMLNVYFGQPVDAANESENLMDFGFKYAQGCHLVPRLVFFSGLSMILAYKVDKKAKRLKTAKLMKQRLKTWVKASNPNVLHLLQLLQGERKYIAKKYEAAKVEYFAAIKSSMRTGFKLDYALSNELLGVFYGDSENPLHDMSQAKFHMEMSLESYLSYGAVNKVTHMKQAYSNYIGYAPTEPHQ